MIVCDISKLHCDCGLHCYYMYCIAIVRVNCVVPVNCFYQLIAPLWIGIDCRCYCTSDITLLIAYLFKTDIRWTM